MTPEWKTNVAEFVVPPIAVDDRRVFVATRDGVVRGLDQATGETLWKVDGTPGRVAAAAGLVVVRGEDGTVWNLQPDSGSVRWRVPTDVAGDLPAIIDGERILVAGRGLAAIETTTGRLLWTEAGSADVTAAPVVAGTRLLIGEMTGALRCRDRMSGTALWAFPTRGALVSPPVVDVDRRRVYLGTTDGQIVELTLDRGRPGWRWRVGADVIHPGLRLGDRVLFAALDAVVYALHRGGNLAWRAPLPSRPLSAPLLVAGGILVACHENDLVGLEAETGRPTGSLRTSAEIRTPPVVAGGRIFLGLRDRSVVAYALPKPADTAAVPPEGGPAVDPRSPDG